VDDEEARDEEQERTRNQLDQFRSSTSVSAVCFDRATEKYTQLEKDMRNTGSRMSKMESHLADLRGSQECHFSVEQRRRKSIEIQNAYCKYDLVLSGGATNA
jgi:hypothetical protein